MNTPGTLPFSFFTSLLAHHILFFALRPCFFPLSTHLDTLYTYIKIAFVLYSRYEILTSILEKNGNVSSLNIQQVILFFPANTQDITEFVVGSYNFALSFTASHHRKYNINAYKPIKFLFIMVSSNTELPYDLAIPFRGKYPIE